MVRLPVAEVELATRRSPAVKVKHMPVVELVEPRIAKVAPFVVASVAPLKSTVGPLASIRAVRLAEVPLAEFTELIQELVARAVVVSCIRWSPESASLSFASFS